MPHQGLMSREVFAKALGDKALERSYEVMNRGGLLFVEHMQYAAYPEQARARAELEPPSPAWPPMPRDNRSIPRTSARRGDTSLSPLSDPIKVPPCSSS
jgi:hypothetical protein